MATLAGAGPEPAVGAGPLIAAVGAGRFLPAVGAGRPPAVRDGPAVGAGN